MKGLEGAFEILRPFIDAKNWDYCVVWKLGDDPSRFFEWFGCFCAGGGRGGGKVEKQSRVESTESLPLCRDLYLKHKIVTKACEALALLPSFIPLYSGVHGEVVTSNQSKWITTPASNSYNESVGTRVLIPVLGGLIELFAAKHIEKDQKIIDFITNHCNVLKQEGTVAHCYSSLSKFGLDPFLENNLHMLPTRSHLLSLLPRTDIVSALNQSNMNCSLGGSFRCSDPSNGHRSSHSHSGYFPQNRNLKHSIEKPSGPRNYQRDQVPDCKNDVSKGTKSNEYRSKNLVTERKRRNRINDGIKALRSIVPKITKMNKVATFEDAINFIRELEEKVKNLKGELKEMEEEECTRKNIEPLTSRLETSSEEKKDVPSDEINQDSDSSSKNKKIEGKIEVNQIGKREFLIKVFLEQKKGGFARLIDRMCSLGLQVVNVNMTTYNFQVLTVLTVEAISKDVEPKRLKESLLKLAG